VFLGDPPRTGESEAAFREDLDADGYVNNHTRLWSWRPDLRTAFIDFRLAFSTINDALGAAPDLEVAAAAPEPVRAAVSYGRPPVWLVTARSYRSVWNARKAGLRVPRVETTPDCQPDSRCSSRTRNQTSMSIRRVRRAIANAWCTYFACDA
jgi:hypothetical protein